MAAHNELGKWGEELAAEYLQEKGYEIIERDWKSGHHDLDIIAKEGGTLVIVEVKIRQKPLRQSSFAFRHHQYRRYHWFDTRD